MRILFTVSLVCLMFAPAFSRLAVAQDKKAPRHNWHHIAYPSLPNPSDGSRSPGLVLQNDKDAGLQLVVSYYVPTTKDQHQKELPSAEKITVRLYSADGKITPAQADELSGLVGFGNARGATYSYIFRLPWKQNVLEEAWIELSLPDQVYWLELPYGFTRNPADPLDQVEARHGRPAFPASMKRGKKDRLVPWLHVHYDLGRIQNNWGLSVNLANPFDAEAEIILYRDDSEVGKSMYLWELHSPRTAMAIKQLGGGKLQGKGMSIRLHEDGLRRSDTFKFDRNAGEDERCWGTATIKVDAKSYECVVPTSLFTYVHGHAAPYDKAQVPRKSNR
jgi:hypothetical protein